MTRLEKIMKKLSREFLEEISQKQSQGEEALNACVVECEQQIHEINAAMENDEELNKTKEALKELQAPYTEALKLERAKIDYIMFKLNDDE